MTMETFLAGAVGTFFILGIWSIAFYKDTAWSRFIELSLVALGVSYACVTSTRTLSQRLVTPLLSGDYSLLLPAILGILIFFQFLPGRHRWPYRWPMAVLTGTQLAVGVRGLPQSNILGQFKGIAATFIVAKGPVDFVSSIFLAVGCCCILIYFTFTREHTGYIGTASKVGRVIMLGGLGFILACLFLARAARLYEALFYIFGDWLNLI